MRHEGEEPPPDRLRATLERLLALDATDLSGALNEATQLVGEALGADKVDAFLYEAASESLVAVGTSDTPMGRHQHAIGLDRLPVANGGRTVEVYLTGRAYHTGAADQDPGELPGLTQGLGIRSTIGCPLYVADQRRGALLAASAAPDYFTAADLRFLQAVARWVGMVAHRAELVEQIAAQATEQGRRLAADELLTVLAHDLRNYLTPINTRADLIRRRAERQQRERDVADADELRRAVQRLTRLVEDLLDARRLEQGLFALSLQPVDLTALTTETATALSSETATIRVQAPAALTIQADPDRLRQALENLLANALQHAPAGTPVEVTVECAEHGDGSYAVLTVADQGPGIPAEVLPYVFTRYARSSQSPGLGLGLYLANRIAAAHGGTLGVDTQPGRGTRFTLSLPLSVGAEEK